MKIFITGGTGFIGSYIVEMLLDDGHTVHLLARCPEKVIAHHENLIVFKGDITDSNSIEDAMVGCEKVYHVAAYAKPWAKDPQDFYRVNLDATKNIFDAAKKHKVDKIVFTSTAGTLGPSSAAEIPVKEEDKRRGIVLTDYENSKIKAEELCRKYVDEEHMNIVIVNPPRVYGPGVVNESNGVTRLVKMYLSGKWRIIPGDGSGVGSYVHVADVAKGYLLAMENGRAGERYILGGENLTYNEFFHILAEVSDKKQQLVKLPYPLMLAAAQLFVINQKITGRPPLITPPWVKKYKTHWTLSSEKATRELGYTFRPLHEGLQETVNWLKEKYSL